MKIMTVIGARPQFIKAAVVSRVIAETAGIEEITVHTGQHYDANMSDVFFSEMGMAPPQLNLAIGSGSHGDQTGRMMIALEEAVQKLTPDLVLVYGDTNSTLAAALVAAKLHVPVAHVEAGLRSFDKKMPEELNRILTDHVSELLFTPTETAMGNLQNEGIAGKKVVNSGDVMYDAALYYAERAKSESDILMHLALESGSYILATVHRAENTDDEGRLRAIFDGLAIVARDTPVVLPLHPRTKSQLARYGIDIFEGAGLVMIEPVGYLDMVQLEKNAAVIVTDSGGVQKEAFFYGVQSVVLRASTEWVELLDLGWVELCMPTTAEEVVAAVGRASRRKGQEAAPFGDGVSGQSIVRSLLSLFGD